MSEQGFEHVREIEPIRRVYGIESELGVTGNVDINAFNALPVDREEYGLGIKSLHQFLSNGARLYKDFGCHIEYSSPECLSLTELVASDIAGQELLYRYMQHDDNKGSAFNTRVTGTNNESWGSHENYLVSRQLDIWDSRNYLPLAAHLATRSVLTGAGYLTEAGNRYLYRISQKIGEKHVGNVVSDTTTRTYEKGLINSKDEPLADEDKYRRIHVTGGDPTMSPWATAVRFGSTSGVLRLIEHGVDLRGLELKNPLNAALITARDATFRHGLELARGNRKVRPAEHQLKLANLCLQLAKIIEIPDDEVLAYELWRSGADDMLKDPKRLEYRADHATKSMVIKRTQGRKDKPNLSERVMEADIFWGELSSRGIAKKIRDKGRFEDPLEAVARSKRYETEAPAGRAAVRGHVIHTLTTKLTRREPASVSWDKFSIGKETFVADDPYCDGTATKRRVNAWMNRHASERVA